MDTQSEIEMVQFYNYSGNRTASRSFEQTKTYLEGFFAAIEGTICSVSISKSASSDVRRVIIIRLDRAPKGLSEDDEYLCSMLIDRLSVGQSNEITRMIRTFQNKNVNQRSETRAA